MHRRRRFSEGDRQIASCLRVPSYLGVAGTDLVRVFDRFQSEAGHTLLNYASTRSCKTRLLGYT
jgi:hypothetical protein